MIDRPRCAREGCDSELNAGAKYCSPRCSNQATGAERAARALANSGSRASAIALSDIEVLRSGAIPQGLEDLLVGKYGHSGTSAMLAEMERQWQGDAVGASAGIVGVDYGGYPYGFPIGGEPSMPRRSKNPPEKGSIEPYTPLLRRAGGHLIDTRRDSKIPYGDIDRMMSLGPCLLASRLKQGPILRTLSSPRKWHARSPDAQLADISRADWQRIFLNHGRDMLTSIPYGMAAGTVVWTQKRTDEIGDFRGIGKGKKWWVVDRIDWAHPSTVDRIIRNGKTMRFSGFQHSRSVHKDDVIIAPPGALLITHDGRFGDLWGTSMFNASYDFAVWYERVMIAFLRFLDEDANKKIRVRGPSHGTVTYMGQKIKSSEYALILGDSVRRTGMFFEPSEVDMNTSNPLWEVSYLKSDQIGTQFIAALRYLSTEILRAAVIGDSSATQNSEFGSRASSVEHNRVTQIDNHLVFTDLLRDCNEHLAPRHGQFNRSYNDPPAIVLEAEVLDPVEQDMLMKLISTIGNFKIGEGSPADMVNWRALFDGLQIPTYSEAEVKKLMDDIMEESKRKAEAFGINGNKPPSDEGEPAQSDADKQEQAVANAIAGGGQAAVMLSTETLARGVATGAIDPGDVT